MTIVEAGKPKVKGGLTKRKKANRNEDRIRIESRPYQESRKKSGVEKGEDDKSNETKPKVRSRVEKNIDNLPNEIEVAMKDFAETNTFEVLHQENTGNQELGACTKWAQNRDRCRGETPCLDATRVVLSTELGGSDFYHANWIKIDKAERPYILAQAPMANTVEDFWRMIFQETVGAIVVTCTFYEEGHESSEIFWPMSTGEYKYYGKMFINNKKTDCNKDLSIFTIEVLPDGCANSLISTIYHCTTWKSGRPPNQIRFIGRLRSAIRTAGHDTGLMTVVGSEGINRSACFVAIDVCFGRLWRGHKTRAVDVIRQLRRQRHNALSIETLYFHVVQAILDYFRSKKLCDAPILKFNADLCCLRNK